MGWNSTVNTVIARMFAIFAARVSGRPTLSCLRAVSHAQCLAVWVLTAGLLGSLVGCTASQRESAWSSGSPLEAAGDWDDIDAAVSVASGEMFFALESREAIGPGRLRYRLLTLGEEPVELEVVRGAAVKTALGEEAEDEAESEMWSGPIALRCRVGRFGDERRERRFLKVMSERLADLAGVDVAPVR